MSRPSVRGLAALASLLGLPLCGCTAIVGVGDYSSGGADAATPASDGSAHDGADDARIDAQDSGAPDTKAGDTGGPDADEGGSCPSPLCNGACCSPTQTCITSNGLTGCAPTCTTNADCDATAPCCAWASSDNGMTWNGQAGCVGAPNGDPNGGSCLCTTSTDCPSGACTPAMGAASGAYVCAPNDGAGGHGCMGSTTCGNGYDCVGDCNGNQYCAASSPSSCTGVFCIVASPTCHNAIFSCSNDCMLCSCE